MWCGMVWHGVVQFDVVWYGMAWYGMVWYGVVWQVWYCMVHTTQYMLWRLHYVTLQSTYAYVRRPHLTTTVIIRLKLGLAVHLCEYLNIVFRIL